MPGLADKKREGTGVFLPCSATLKKFGHMQERYGPAGRGTGIEWKNSKLLFIFYIISIFLGTSNSVCQNSNNFLSR